MDIGKVFPSRYLKVGDLDGRDIAVVIKDVKLENVGQKGDSKPVAYFRNANKGLVLNVTNSKRIAAIAGSEDTDDWKGTKITLYGTETEFAGETVECIRVRVPKKATPEEPSPAKNAKKIVKTKRAVEPEPDDEIPGAVEPATVIEQDFDPDDQDVPF